MKTCCIPLFSSINKSFSKLKQTQLQNHSLVPLLAPLAPFSPPFSIWVLSRSNSASWFWAWGEKRSMSLAAPAVGAAAARAAAGEASGSAGASLALTANQGSLLSMAARWGKGGKTG